MTIHYRILDKRIGQQWAKPTFATEGSAGIDLIACLNESTVCHANEVSLIPSGIAIHIANPNIAGIILPRSGLGHKHGIILGNSAGLIDSDYQGELLISVWNRSQHDYTIEPGTRIAQLVLVPIIKASLTEVSQFDDITERHDGGFGSTGYQTEELS